MLKKYGVILTAIMGFVGIFDLATACCEPTFDLDLHGKIKGVWELTRFDLVDAGGNITPWCEGAHGIIMYAQDYMSVAINCESHPEKMLHYSGPYEIRADTVIHKVRNFSDPSLHHDFQRKIKMPGYDQLELEGPTADGGKAVIYWKRR